MNFESLNTAVAKLFNHIFRTGEFPEQWKTAIITPILKQNPKHPSSYRPISILPFLSKVFEKILSCTLYKHTSSKMSQTQFGFRNHLSTSHALANFTQTVHNELDKNQVVAAVYYDLTKAFDLVDHEKLISRLETVYKIPSHILNIVKSYLQNRQFKIKLNGKISEAYPLLVWVPQGSCLGPLLFNLAFDDVDTSLTDATKIVKYADDIGCIISGTSIDSVTATIVKCTEKLDQWCNQNHMKLNYSKTKYMFFKYARSKRDLSKIQQSLCINVTVYFSKYLLRKFFRVFTKFIPVGPVPT